MTALPQQAEYTQEVRFAVVMYGGVSLAIYINGIAQELLRMVRSTSASVPAGKDKRVPVAGGQTHGHRTSVPAFELSAFRSATPETVSRNHSRTRSQQRTTATRPKLLTLSTAHD